LELQEKVFVKMHRGGEPIPLVVSGKTGIGVGQEQKRALRKTGGESQRQKKRGGKEYGKKDERNYWGIFEKSQKTKGKIRGGNQGGQKRAEKGGVNFW